MVNASKSISVLIIFLFAISSLINVKCIAQNKATSTKHCISIADSLSKVRSYDESNKYLHKALVLFEQKQNVDSIIYCCYLLGYNYKNLAKLDSAIRYLEWSKELAVKTQNPLLANVYNNLGISYKKKGEYNIGLNYYQKALYLNIDEVGEFHPKVAAIYNNIGNIYIQKSDYEEALAFHSQALNIRQSTLDNDHPHIAQSNNNLGIIHGSLGYYKKAIKVFNIAEKIFLKNFGENHPSVAQCYNNVAFAYAELNDNKNAIYYINKSLDIKLKLLPSNHPLIAEVYNNLGTYYYLEKQWDKAFELQDKALRIYLAAYGNYHPFVSREYVNLGRTLLNQIKATSNLNQIDLCIENYQSAIASNVTNYSKLNIYTNPDLDKCNSQLYLLNALIGKSETLYQLAINN